MDPREELQALLSIEGVTTGKVAREAGITQQAVSAMQTGRLRVSEVVLRSARIVACEVLGDAVSSGLDILKRSMGAVPTKGQVVRDDEATGSLRQAP